MIGKMVASEPGVDYAALFYKVSKGAKIRNRYNQVPHLTQDTNGESDKLTVRHHKPLEKVKEHQLRINKGNFDCYMLSKEAKGHIQWWIDHIPYTNKTVMSSGHSMSFSQTH